MKVKKEELISAREKMFQVKSTFENNLDSMTQKATGLVMSQNMVSKTKDAIDSELKNYSIPLLLSYRDLINAIYNELDRLILNFQEVVGETDEKAVINTDVFSNLKKLTNDTTDDILEVTDSESLKNAYTNISSIIALENPSSSNIGQKRSDAINSLVTTTNNMQNFNSQQRAGIINQISTSVSTGLNKVSKTVNYTNPYLNSVAINVFNDTELYNATNNNHKALQKYTADYIKHYNPDMAFEPHDLTLEELQKLGRVITLSSYNNHGKIPNELEKFLKGQSVSYEKEIKIYDTGASYLKTKVALKLSKGKSIDTVFAKGRLDRIGFNSDYISSSMDKNNGVTFGPNYPLQSGGLYFNSRASLDLSNGVGAAVGLGNKNTEVVFKTEYQGIYRVDFSRFTTKYAKDDFHLINTTEAGIRTIDQGLQATATVSEFAKKQF